MISFQKTEYNVQALMLGGSEPRRPVYDNLVQLAEFGALLLGKGEAEIG